MRKILLIGLFLFALTACGGSGGNPSLQEDDCLPNEIVPCLGESWSTWYVWLDEYGYNEYVISDGKQFTYDGVLLFESGLFAVRLAGIPDGCQHGTVYTMWLMATWYDVEGTLSLCGDMLSLSALSIDGEPITEPK